MPEDENESKITVERAVLERLRRDLLNVKRAAEQARKDAERNVGVIDKLLAGQATDSKA